MINTLTHLSCLITKETTKIFVKFNIFTEKNRSNGNQLIRVDLKFLDFCCGHKLYGRKTA